MVDVHCLQVINTRLPHPLPARSLLLRTHNLMNNVQQQKDSFTQFLALLKRKRSYSDDVLLLCLLQLVKDL